MIMGMRPYDKHVFQDKEGGFARVPLTDDEEVALAESLGWTAIKDMHRCNSPHTNWSKFENVIQEETVIVWNAGFTWVRAIRVPDPEFGNMFYNRTRHQTLREALECPHVASGYNQ